MKCRDCGRKISMKDLESYGDRLCGCCAIGRAYAGDIE